MFYGIFHYKDNGCSFTHMKGPFESLSEAYHAEVLETTTECGRYSYSDTFVCGIPKTLGQKVLDWAKYYDYKKVYVRAIGDKVVKKFHVSVEVTGTKTVKVDDHFKSTIKTTTLSI